MNTAILPDGVSYYIPKADLPLFTELARRMKWQIVDKRNLSRSKPLTGVWVDSFAGKWQDERSTLQIINDIHEARTNNSEIEL